MNYLFSRGLNYLDSKSKKGGDRRIFGGGSELIGIFICEEYTDEMVKNELNMLHEL